jgi:hypothetical protein
MGQVHDVVSDEACCETCRKAEPTTAPAPMVRGHLTPAAYLALQRSSGNLALGRLLRQEVDAAASSGAPQEGAGGAEQQEAEQGDDADLKLDPVGAIPAPTPVPVEYNAAGPTLEGKTSAAYGGTDAVIAPDPPNVSRGPNKTIIAKATVSATFASNPTVAMPDIDNRGFTACQHKNAEKFLQSTLGPHEQLHVQAFKTNFDGAWSKPFTLTVKDTEDLKTQVKALYDAEFASRKAKADAASAALDANGKNVFTWDMDAACP